MLLVDPLLILYAPALTPMNLNVDLKDCQCSFAIYVINSN